MALIASPWREKPDYPELDPMDPINRGRIFSSSLGDGRGLTCRDISRYKNNGTLNNFGAYPWVPGFQGGQAIKTDGSTTFVDFGAPSQLEFVATDQFTIAVRVKSSANPGAQSFAIGKDFSTGSRGFGIGISTSGQLYIESGGQVAFSGTGPVFGNTGRSTLIGGNQSGDANQNWTGFVNGLSIGTLNSSFTYAANSLAHWYVGGRSYSGFFNGLSAVIENFDIWNRQLSAAEWLRLNFDPFAGLRFDSDEGYRAIAGGGNVPTNITLAQASWLWTGRAVGVNAKTMIALAQAVWTWTGFATAINAKTMIKLGQASWQWVGRPLAGAAGTVIQSLLTLLGLG